MNLKTLLLSWTVLVPLALCTEPDVLGPAFEPPTNLATEKTILSTAANVTQLLQGMFLTGKTPYGNMVSNDTALSVQVVSLDSDRPLIDFHHTPGNLNVSAGSTAKVDADSVYRIASISKLFTVYTLLVNKGRQYWDTPVADLIHELKAQHGGSVIEQSQWNEVTVGALASQMGGVSADYGNGDLSMMPFPAEAAGLPKLSPQDVPTCSGTNEKPACSRSEFFKGYLKQHPVSRPYTMAAYANAGFRLLNYVVQKVVKSSYGEAIQTTVFKPLGLSKSSTSRPKENGAGVVPRGESAWFRDMGDDVSTAGLFSSIRDLSQFGKAILGNKQLSSMETHRWMKPQAHTASRSISVGAPWEILRTSTGTTSGRSLDLYTKGGVIGLYSSMLILIPDFNVVISILGAGSDAALAVTMATETTLQKFLPELERTAREQARRNFGGDYVSANISTNSTLTIAVEDNVPGLVLKKWISNGADVMLAFSLFAQGLGRQLQRIALYPMDLATKNSTCATKQSYRAIIETVDPHYDAKVPRVIDVNAIQWTMFDAFRYGGISIDDFVFHIDAKGVARGVEPRVLRETFTRK